MENGKENLEFNTLSDELLKEVSAGIGFHLKVLPGMSPETAAAVEEVKTLTAKIKAIQNAARTGAISMQEYDARSGEVQQWMERIQYCMGHYNLYLQGANSQIGR